MAIQFCYSHNHYHLHTLHFFFFYSESELLRQSWYLVKKRNTYKCISIKGMNFKIRHTEFEH